MISEVETQRNTAGTNWTYRSEGSKTEHNAHDDIGTENKTRTCKLDTKMGLNKHGNMRQTVETKGGNTKRRTWEQVREAAHPDMSVMRKSDRETWEKME